MSTITRTVRTQAELDAAVEDGADVILIRSDPDVWLTVEAFSSATVRAFGSSTVEAFGSATVEATAHATVRAFDSVTVRAFDWATVEAAESSTVEAFDFAFVDAAPRVEVHIYSRRVTLNGGIVVDEIALDLRDPAIWCKFHDVEVVEHDGVNIAFLYKAVNSAWTTDRGWDYSPGATPEAASWEPNGACGAGLHFSPRPAQAARYLGSPAHFVRVGVRMDELSPISSDMAKARRVVVPCVEVDINGKDIS